MKETKPGENKKHIGIVKMKKKDINIRGGK